MGKTIIQQARGHGSLTYRVRPKAYRFRVTYPKLEGKAKVMKIINSPAHSSPIAKVKIGNEIFYNIAVNGLQEGQEIEIGKNVQPNTGNIMPINTIPVGTSICNVEAIPYNGPKFIRASGLSAKITKKIGNDVFVLLPSKQEKPFDGRVRATIGIVAASGRRDKPIAKAGKMWHMMKARNKLWPRTSAVKMNAVDHPFGCGRGKRIKSKIAKRNAPPGAKVGLLRPRRTGRRKK